jgi:hypothetical protein
MVRVNVDMLVLSQEACVAPIVAGVLLAGLNVARRYYGVTMRIVIPILFSMLLAVSAQAQQYDIVLAHGRVLDPASGLDAVRYVGIRGDIPTLEVLAESLTDFPGAPVLVTHDRYMLDRVSTVVLRAERTAFQAPEMVSDPIALQRRYAEMQAAEAEVEKLYARWAELEGKLAWRVISSACGIGNSAIPWRERL